MMMASGIPQGKAPWAYRTTTVTGTWASERWGHFWIAPQTANNWCVESMHRVVLVSKLHANVFFL